MKKHCGNMVMVVAFMACLLLETTCHATEPPSTAENSTMNVQLQQQRRVVNRRLLGLTDATTFSSYLFALQWPPGACATGMLCQGNIPADFTIHGLWPQDSNNKGVPAYGTDKSCTTLTPVPPNKLIVELQKGNLVGDLTNVWPTLKNTNSAQENQKFWEYEWGKHGMCSDYGDKPAVYFKAAIDLRNHFVSVLKLQSGQSYKVQEIADKVKAAVKGTPEIACRTKKGTNQKILGEVRLCYNKGNPTPKGIRDCTRAYSGNCNSVQDVIAVL
ncbi:hypothetical protein F3Y22_tig00110956pilonHSYRG00092 [Hibiscus syriacus]|uniref:Uncharacterized protein n=2 Tax=Hibiscus syriacus TaxID=106335 RepID=A0A6A2ZCN9_HIBSY|nr:hypothetical protein F3Y22_tig00110956pilonHSYRG00092 [Hibiscus syriacus]